MPSSSSSNPAWTTSSTQSRLEFVDLNHDDVSFVPNRFGATSLRELALPATLRRADLIVSLPKMKTHHWAGVTLSLKNFFGVMPGIVYGWPKNVLHHAGIGRFDPRHRRGGPAAPGDRRWDHRHGRRRPDHGHAAARGRSGHGDEPAGRRRHLLATDGDQPLADRLPGWRHQGRLGPIAERHIDQRGESIVAMKQRFQLLDQPSFQVLRT